MSFLRILLLGLGKVVAAPIRRHLAAFERATHDPRTIQEALLRRILDRQAETDFGRDHHFRSATTVEAFRRQVPVAGYDAYEPYIARLRRGDYRALLADGPVRMFALTSGTTASRKYIPVTDHYLADYKRGWNIWGLRVFRDHKNVRLRPIVQLSGDHEESYTEAGIPCGAVTGMTAAMQKRIVHWLYCVPGCVGKVKDAASKYYLVLRLSLPRRVGMIVAANPSTMIALARLGDVEKESLLRDLRDGTLSERFSIPDTVRASLAARLRRQHPERVRALEEIIRRTGHLYPKDYWPQKDLLLGNWTGGSMGAYLRHYPQYYGDAMVRDVGLIASEGRMTIPLEDNTASGVLDITSHYFEFLPEEEAQSPAPRTLGAHELEVGRSYYILPTTAFGLYRYHIHDLVRVTGFHNRTPLVEFLSKGSYFSNLTGEKLSEYHVTQAMAQVLCELNMTLTCYSVAPCWSDEIPYYGLFVECADLPDREQAQRLAARLDAQLATSNVEYQAKRESARLGPLRVQLLPEGIWAEWDRKRLQRNGGSLEQYKHPCLINDTQFRASMPVEAEVP